MNQSNIVGGNYEGTTGRMQFKNWIISEIEKEILALTCLETISFEMALRNVCSKSEVVRSYVGQNLRVNSNFKVRSLRDAMKDRQGSEEYELVKNAKALTFRRIEQGFPKDGSYGEKMTYLAKKISYETNLEGKKCARRGERLIPVESDEFYSGLKRMSAAYFNGAYNSEELQKIIAELLKDTAAKVIEASDRA